MVRQTSTKTGNDEIAPNRAHPDPVLPGDVPRIADEALLDWLFRASALHGYRSPDIIGTLVGGAFPDVARDPRFEAKLAALLSAEIIEIKKSAVRTLPEVPTQSREAGRVFFFGHSLLELQLRTMAHRICPFCLSEEAYLRNSWALALCGVCHRHACEMVDRCPACENQLQYNRRKIEFCRCGFDLRWIQPVPASREATHLWRYIDDLLNSRTIEHAEAYAEEIRALSLDSLLNLLPILAAIKSNADRTSSLAMLLSNAGQYSAKELRSMNEAAAEMLGDWPSALEKHILRGLAVLPRGAAILQNATGSVTALSGWALPPELSFLDDIVERCVSSRWKTFLQQIQVDQVVSVTCQMARQPAPATEVIADDVMPIRDAATLLGMETRDAMLIFPSRHLKPPLRGRPSSPRIVTKEAVYAWCATIEGRHNPWVDSPLDQFRRFHEAKTACSHLAINTSALLAGIESGRIRICVPPGLRFKLDSAYLNERDLIAWWQESAAVSGLEEIRAGVVRRIMGIGEATFERLIEKGAIPFNSKPKGPDHRKGMAWRIFESMRSLRVLRRIEEFCGVRAGDLEGRLEGAGVSLLTGSDVDPEKPRELRMVEVSELQRPVIFEFLRQSACTKWTAS